MAKRQTEAKDRQAGASAPETSAAVAIRASSAPEVVQAEEVGAIDERKLWNECMTAVDNFMLLYGFEDINKISQQQFSFMLDCICDECIKDIYNLKTDSGYMYDMDKVEVIYNIYIRLCKMYDKMVSIDGFSCISGIEYETIIDWGGGKGRKATPAHVRFSKKIYNSSEVSLANILATGKRNPVGLIAILNHRHGWATQTIRHEHTTAPPDIDNIASRMGLEMDDSKDGSA